MRERDVELYLKKQVEKIGGLCWKFTSPGTRGVPDRVLVLKSGVYFVEVKAPGGRVSPMQTHRINQLEARNANAKVLDSKDAVDEFISHVASKAA